MKVYELLDSKEKWTQGAQARNACGCVVDPLSLTATSWSLQGAIPRCYGTSYTDRQANAVLKKIYSAIGNVMDYEWNDDPERTHAEVLTLAKELDI